MAPTIRVLLVDPDAEERLSIRKALRGREPRFRVTDAPGLHPLPAHLTNGDYDVALVDMDGWAQPFEAVERVQAIAPDLPLLALTRSHAARDAVPRGVDGVVMKSQQDFDRLPAAIPAVLERAKQRRDRTALLRQAQSSEQRYRLLFDGVRDALFVCDAHGTILEVNRAAERLLNRPASDVAGTAFARWVSSPKRLRLADLPAATSMRLVLRPSPLPVEARVNALALDDQTLYLVVLHDVQRDERSAQALQALTAAAAAMQGALTPPDVFRAAGEQLRSMGLMLSVFRWLEDENALVMTHTELARRVLNAARRVTGLDPTTFHIAVAGSPSIQSVLASDGPVILTDATQIIREMLPGPLRHFALPLQKAMGYNEQFALRLKVGDQIYGLIFVGYTTGQLVEADRPLIEAFASQIQAALERARRFEEAQTRLAAKLGELTQLVHVGEQMQLRLPIDALLDRVCRAVHDSLGWERVIVWLRDSAASALRPRAAVGVPPSEWSQQPALDEALWRRTSPRTGRAVFAPRGDADQRAWQPGDVLVIPIEAGGEDIGVLQVDRPAGGRRPAPDELVTLELFANQAAVAVENADLYARAHQRLQQRTDELAALTTLSAITDQGDLRRSLEQALDRVLHISGMDAAGIALLDRSTGELRPYVHLGVSEALWDLEQGAPTRIGEGIAGRALAAGSAIVVSDVNSDPRVPYRDALLADAVQTVAGVGLTGRNPVGAMTLYARESRRLSAETLDWLTIAGRQIALSIENMRLLDSTRRRQQMAEAIREVSAAVASTLDLDAALNTLFDQIRRVVPYTSSSIQLVETDGLRTTAVRGLPDPAQALGRVFPRDERIPGWQAVTRRDVIVLDDAQQVEGWVDHSSPVARAWIGAPLIAHNEVIGLLTLDHEQPGFFTPEDGRNAALIAAQAAVAIDNARRFAAERLRSSRLRALNDLGRQLIVALERDTILALAAEHVARDFGYAHAEVFLLDPASGDWVWHVYNGGPPPSDSAMPQRVSPGQGIVGRVAATGRTYLSGDVAADPHYLSVPERKDVRSEIAIPLHLDDRLVGVLNIESDRLHAFDADDVAILETLAGQINAALSLAELYHETQQRAGNLSTLFAASQELGSSLDSDQVFGRLAQWVVSAADATSARVYVWDLPAGTGRLLAQYVGARATPIERQSMIGTGQNLSDVPQLVKVMQSRRPLIFTADATPLDVPLLVTLRTRDVAGALYLPLTVRERLIGCVEVWETGPAHAWAPEVIHICQTIANVAAGAIDNARLFEVERQRRAVAETVRDLAAVVSSSLDLPMILEALLDRAAELIPYDSAAVHIVPLSLAARESPGLMRIEASRGVSLPPASALIDVSPDSLVGRVLRSRQVSICADVRDCDVGDSPEATEVRGWLGAPLVVKARAIGVLTFDSRTPGRYRREHADIAETIANQAAVAIENARLYQETRQRVAELETLQAVSLELIQSLDVARVSQAIADGALRLLHATVVHLFSFDAEADTLHGLAMSSAPGYETVGQPTPRREGLTMQVAHAGQVVVINDPYHDPAHALVIQAWPGQVQAIAGLPLQVRGRVLGVMNVIFHAPHFIDDDDVRILSLLADQAATALENARLFEDEQRRRVAADVLREISAVLTSTLDLSELFERLFDQIERVMPVTRSSALLMDGPEYMRVVAGRGFQEPQRVIGLRVNLERSRLSGEAIRTRRPLIVDDIQGLPDWTPMPGLENIHSWLGAPLIARDEILGTLTVEHLQAGAYRRDLAELLGVIANQAAAAIANARLYEQALERERFASALGRTSLAIMSTLELNVVLEQICRESAEAFSVDTGLVWLLEGDEMVGFAAHGPAREAFLGVRVTATDSGTLGVRVIQQHTGELVNDAEHNPRANAEMIRRTGLKSLLAAPMFDGDTPIGSLVIADSRRVDRFMPSDIDRAQVLAQHATIAIKNARLFQAEQRRARQLALVNRVGLDVTSILDLKQLAQKVVEEIRGVLGYYYVGVALVEGDEMVWRAGAGGDVAGYTAPAVRRRLGVGIVGAAAQSGEVVLVPDVRLDARFVTVPEIARTRSEVALPLKAKGAVLGVLDVESERVSAFGDDELAMLTALAGQLSVAVENAQLYAELSDYAASLETRVAERTAEIRREQERTITILNSVADAVLVTDLVGSIVLTNPVADDLLREDAPGDLPDSLRAWLRDLSPTDTAPKIALGDRTWQAAGAFIREDDRKVGHVIVLRDITRMEEVNRLKTQFVTNVSHELRTPLTNIKLYLGLFQKGKPEKREQYLLTLQNEVNRLERLIADLLDLSQLERGRQEIRRKPIDLAEVLRHVAATLEPQAEAKQQALRLAIDGAPLTLPADRNQMIQVFVNLTANAINYTPRGGHIGVQAAARDRGGQPGVAVSVHDDGIGIPAEDRERIFDRFYRGQVEQYGVHGTGLGLAIVKEIVDQHGGHIDLVSNVGSGSTFSVWLPAHAALGGAEEREP